MCANTCTTHTAHTPHTHYTQIPPYTHHSHPFDSTLCRVFNLDDIQLIFVFFTPLVLNLKSTTHWVFSSVVPGSFVRLHFTFTSVVHCQLLFVKTVDVYLGSSFACGCLAIPATFVEETSFAPLSNNRKVKRRCAGTWRRQRFLKQNTKPIQHKGRLWHRVPCSV